MKPFRIFQSTSLLRRFQQAHQHSRLRLETITRISQGARARRPLPASFSTSALSRLLFRQSRTPLIRRAFAQRRPNSTKPPFNPTPHLNSPEPSLSLTQRLRKLSREYGWSALGVYLLLSAVDFPFCFIAVRWLGTDRIGHWEHVIVERFWMVVELVMPNIRARGGEVVEDVERVGVGQPVGGAIAQVDAQSNEVGVPGYDHGVKEAEKRNKAEASIWTQLALAYAIHKSFIFIRVPLTAALTPKVVRVLRGWGWDIGKRKPKAVRGKGTKS